MSFLIKHIDNLLTMDWQTFVALAVLCAFASYFIKEYLATPPMVIFVYPVLLCFAILIQYVFIQAELYPPNKLDQWLMWTIIASICGTILGTVVGVLMGVYGAVRQRKFFDHVSTLWAYLVLATPTVVLILLVQTGGAYINKQVGDPHFLPLTGEYDSTLHGAAFWSDRAVRLIRRWLGQMR
jgi:ABC-type phosphate transport system permease subunit